MTAIYSYASPEDRIGFVAADNIDLENHVKVDKVTFLGGRYAIGTYGKGVVTQALDSIAAFEMFENVISPRTLEEILAEAWEITKVLCAKHYEVWKNGKKGNDAVTIESVEFLNSSTTLIILDCEEFELYKVEQTHLFPPNKIDITASIIKMNDNVLHLSSFASFAARRDYENTVFSNKEQILSFLKSRIEEDQKKVNTIGGLGSVVIVHNESITCHTSFDGAKDYISRLVCRS